MSSRDSRFARKLVQYRWLLLSLGLISLAIAWPIDRQLVFDRRIERLFPENDPATAAYEKLKTHFGGNEIAVLSYRRADLFNPDGSGLLKLEGLSREISKIPGVTSVLSLSKVNQALGRIRPTSFFGAGGDQAETAILGDDALARSFRELFASYTHSPDGEQAALVVMLSPDRARSNHADRVIMRLREIADSLPVENQPSSLVGEPVLVDEGFTLADADGKRLGRVSLGLLSVVVLIMFRSPKWVIAQVVIIGWSTIVTRALLASIGLRLTLVSSMLTAVITVVAVASVIHIAVADRNARLRGYYGTAAVTVALAQMMRPIAWACLTDAVGFGALWVSSVGPIQDFGVMMAIGVLAVLLAIILFVPCLAMLTLRDPAKRPRRANRMVRRWFYGIYRWLDSHRVASCVGLLIALGTIAIGMSRLQVETNFIRNFRENHRLAIDYGTVETELGGAGVWDILLPAPEQLSPAYLQSVRILEERLRSIGQEESGPQGLTKVLSIADADAAAGSTPLLAIAPPALRIAGMRAAMPHFVDALITQPDPQQNVERTLRIMMRSREQVSATTKQELISRVHQVVHAHTSGKSWSDLFKRTPQGSASPPSAPLVTGYHVLLTGLVSGLLKEQWLCFGVASLGVFLMLSVATSSWRLALGAMVPNVLPIFGVMASLGWLGWPVNLGTAMIAAVSIGISIDGSIHFLVAYQRHRAGHNCEQSIRRLYKTVGIAIILATVCLVIGFATLVTSPFMPTATFGTMVSVSLVASSIANLTLLPFVMRMMRV